MVYRVLIFFLTKGIRFYLFLKLLASAFCPMVEPRN